MNTNSLQLLLAAQAKGIHFDPRLYAGFGKSANEIAKMGMDANTTGFNPASNGVPPQYLTAYAPETIKQMLNKRAYMEIGAEMQMGSFATDQAMVPVQGLLGYVAPYDDYSSEGRSDINNTFPMRDFYRGQTVIEYGELEEAQLAEAKINVVADKQYSAGENIAIAQNKAFFFGNCNSAGVFLQQNYGILNNPQNIPFVAVNAGATSTKVPWSQKLPPEINTDVVTAFATLQSQLSNNLSNNDPLQLCLSGVASAYLYATTNEFGISAYDTLKKNFPNLTVVTAPEYGSFMGGSFQLIATSKLRSGVVRDLFTYRYRAHFLFPQGSSFRQKFSFGTGGCLVTLPAAIASFKSIGS